MLKLRSGLAGLLVAMTCSMGLVVGTSVRAEALVDIDLGKVAKTTLSKGVTVGKGATLFGRFSNPAGWIITGGMAAWWAYDNRDGIVDFLNGPDTCGTLSCWAAKDPEWDGAFPEANSDANTGMQITSVIDRDVYFNFYCKRIGPHPNPAVKTVKYCGDAPGMNGIFDPSPVNSAVPAQSLMACKNLTTLVVRTVPIATNGATLALSSTWNTDYPSNGAGAFTGPIKFCSAGEAVVGVRFPPMKPGTGFRPTYSTGWGSLSEELPDGQVTFDEAIVTAKCRNAVTGERRKIKATSDLGGSGSVVVPSCKAHLGDDWYGEGFTIAPTKPKIDGEPIPDEVEVPDFLPIDWDELIPEPESPDWQPCHGTKKGCTLDVWIDDEPCDEDRTVCRKWTKVMEKSPDRVKCVYGSKPVAMKNCLPLAGYYQPGTDTKTDGTTKPDTGTTTPDTGTDTGTGTQVPKEGQQPKPNADNDADKAKCFPGGWGLFNPVEWVYRPVKCALTWAFVPSTGIGVRIDRMKGQMEGRAPFSWASSLSGLSGAISGGGCPTSWAFTFKGRQYSLICGTPAEGVIRAARPVMLVLTMGAAAYPLIRSLVYSSTPIVKPTPT